MSKENPMTKPRIEKITLNIGTSSEQKDLKNAAYLLKTITGKKPVRTYSKHRIPTWNLRKGLPIGVKVTIRGKDAEELLKRLLDSVSFKISKRAFTNHGFSFGIPEYIQIEGVEYNPKIGIIGLEAAVTFEKPGYRIKRRRLFKKPVPKKQQTTKEEIMNYVQKELNVKVE